MKSLPCGALFAAAFLMTGCTTEPPFPTPTSSPVAVSGVWGSSEPSEAGLIIHEGGEFEAHDGCGGGGTWQADGATISFTISTMNGVRCNDIRVDKLTTGVVSDDAITLFDERGLELGVLVRATG
jgi:hypothetical protein